MAVVLPDEFVSREPAVCFVAAFLAGHGDFGIEAPAGFPLALDERGVLRCLPHRHGTDGFTAVRLRRAG